MFWFLHFRLISILSVTFSTDWQPVAVSPLGWLVCWVQRRLAPLSFFLLFVKNNNNLYRRYNIKGADALTQEPHAVRLEVFCSFQITVEWYFQPISLAIIVRSAQILCCPPLFLSSGTFRQNLPSGLCYLITFFQPFRRKNQIILISHFIIMIAILNIYIIRWRGNYLGEVAV